MGNVTRSEQNNIKSPDGNSLAVFVDGISEQMKVKDVMGNIQPLSDFVSLFSSPFKLDANGTGIEPCLGSNNASGCFSIIGGGSSNTTYAQYSTIGGGKSNTASGISSTVGGGFNNDSIGGSSTVGGGLSNSASACFSTIGGGNGNTIIGCLSTVGGGQYNIATGNSSTIGGGCLNTASGVASAILGGLGNLANCSCSMIVGSNITADRVCATFVNNLSIKNIPTSSAGLPSGSIYRIGNAVCIVI